MNHSSENQWDRDEAMEAVDAAIARGKKIEAVKLYREFSGQSLRQCKAFVESRMKQTPPGLDDTEGDSASTDPTAIDSQRSGCFPMLMLILSFAGLCCIGGLLGTIIRE
ncbi:hypothetical protein [Stieleria mannarensis]|uniref:hypothetical protein n=1 Tax=Stieleria mannarensis TaxID=2755585 RepID=UPI0016002F24|nr:hypothetical protein [Rhodopirellula sp. JC639]